MALSSLQRSTGDALLKLRTEKLGVFRAVKFFPAFLLVSDPSLAEILAALARLCCEGVSALWSTSSSAPSFSRMLLPESSLVQNTSGQLCTLSAEHIWPSGNVRQRAKPWGRGSSPAVMWSSGDAEHWDSVSSQQGCDEMDVEWGVRRGPGR